MESDHTDSPHSTCFQQIEERIFLMKFYADFCINSLMGMFSHPGRVYSAEELYERVWESDAYAVENTVMVHISRIREKLELNPKKPEYLKVIWGIGYVFEAP